MCESKKCPSCKSDCIYTTYSLYFSLSEWPLAIGITGVILVAGEVLGFSQLLSFKFAGLGAFPVLCRFLKKNCCYECGTQTLAYVDDELAAQTIEKQG